ncbi:MAG: hypothetical protein KDA63_15125 [Planctomycetales bacterium]|nr:hypothetical protein [Planctomycetales bacterium]
MSIYQKNKGVDSDWIAEGDLTDAEIAELLRTKNVRGLEFGRVMEFPPGSLRGLARMRSLRQLCFRSCLLSDDEMAAVASVERLESLWCDDCPVTDTGIENLAGHQRLQRVVIVSAHITDVSAEHLATIPRLIWVGLDDTDITDASMEHLAALTGLETLSFRGTRVTDDGILKLASLSRLNLVPGQVRDTAVTETGLNALFTAQKAAIKATRSAKKSKAAPEVETGKAKRAAELDVEEIESARRTLFAYFKAMNEWATQCSSQYNVAERQSPSGNVAEELWQTWHDECRAIFDQFCTPKKRAYGRPDNISVGRPPDYMPEPDDEPITGVETPTKRRIVIETKQSFGMKERCQYVLVKNGDRWLVDSKKKWGAGWEWTIL